MYAVDDQGTLWTLTAQALYRATADAPDLRLFYRADADAPLHGLVVAGRRVWLGEGDDLALVEGDLVARTGPLRLDHPLLVAGSPSGDVWVTTPGRLQRLTRDDGALLPDERWAQQIAPVFGRACATCHLPTGRAGLDLSVASAWDTERDVIRERVLQKRTMPPPADHPLVVDEDRQAIARYAGSTAARACPARSRKMAQLRVPFSPVAGDDFSVAARVTTRWHVAERRRHGTGRVFRRHGSCSEPGA